MSGWMLIDVALFAILLCSGIAIAKIRQLFAVAMLSGIFSLTSACIFVMQDAVDVAFTEAAVGAGMTTVLLLGALALTRTREKLTPTARSVPALLVALTTGALLVHASGDLPAFGIEDSPVQTHPVTERYLVSSVEEIGVPNVVTSVLASYRGYDTFGEVVVIFTAAVAVLMLLGQRAPREVRERAAPMRDRQRVLRVIAKLLIPFILLFGLYVQFHGDYGPGGGFQAGVIFAAGVVLYALVFGLDAARAAVPMRALRPLLAAGVLLYGGVGVATLLLGGAFLDYDLLAAEDPVAGQHLGILLVELGVGITVTSAMIMLFYGFAGRGIGRGVGRS
ncbi:Na(+)/H(+) antiporter subunit B [Sinimarinibacterium thermocellulolyticum]|uniref:Na(+)/H(+) antiporter subunit B n=1 Tax=Sinimarinibacterium thermocellulolyticum TaxID=3170016 RepID=A0ABV2A767_9GAMM